MINPMRVLFNEWLNERRHGLPISKSYRIAYDRCWIHWFIVMMCVRCGAANWWMYNYAFNTINDMYRLSNFKWDVNGYLVSRTHRRRIIAILYSYIHSYENGRFFSRCSRHNHDGAWRIGTEALRFSNANVLAKSLKQIIISHTSCEFMRFFIILFQAKNISTNAISIYMVVLHTMRIAHTSMGHKRNRYVNAIISN